MPALPSLHPIALPLIHPSSRPEPDSLTPGPVMQYASAPQAALLEQYYGSNSIHLTPHPYFVFHYQRCWFDKKHSYPVKNTWLFFKKHLYQEENVK